MHRARSTLEAIGGAGACADGLVARSDPGGPHRVIRGALAAGF
jgi:hypothetical protein